MPIEGEELINLRTQNQLLQDRAETAEADLADGVTKHNELLQDLTEARAEIARLDAKRVRLADDLIASRDNAAELEECVKELKANNERLLKVYDADAATIKFLHSALDAAHLKLASIVDKQPEGKP
jgi:chromosome segregation ATPase